MLAPTAVPALRVVERDNSPFDVHNYIDSNATKTLKSDM